MWCEVEKFGPSKWFGYSFRIWKFRKLNSNQNGGKDLWIPGFVKEKSCGYFCLKSREMGCLSECTSGQTATGNVEGILGCLRGWNRSCKVLAVGGAGRWVGPRFVRFLTVSGCLGRFCWSVRLWTVDNGAWVGQLCQNRVPVGTRIPFSWLFVRLSDQWVCLLSSCCSWNNILSLLTDAFNINILFPSIVGLRHSIVKLRVWFIQNGGRRFPVGSKWSRFQIFGRR